MKKASIVLILCAAFIFSLGLVMIFNTTSAEVLDKSLKLDTHHHLVRQMVYSVFGILGGLCAYKLGYQNILRLSPFFLFLCTVGLVLVFIPPLGQKVNGAYRWLGICGFTVQPSEFAKYILPLYLVHRIVEVENIDLKSFSKIVFIFFLPLILILIEPDNGTCAILLFSLLVVCLLTRVKWTYWMLPFLFFVLLSSVLAFNMPHVSDRIKIYLNPEKDLLGKGHQPYQAKIAAGSGRLSGKGLGESLQKLTYLPEAKSDYIAAIYAEETGFLGMIVLIFLYMLLSYIGFFIAGKSKSREGFYVAAIITFMMSFQVFLNLGVVSGLLPSKGIVLPLFSQGGSSLMANAIALFVVLSVARLKEREVA